MRWRRVFQARHRAVAARQRSERLLPCRQQCHHPHRAPHHQGWRGPLASGGASFQMAGCAEVLLQVVVGAWQIRHVVAAEQARPVAGGHDAKVGCRAGKRAQVGVVRAQWGQHLLQYVWRRAAASRVVVVGEQMRRVVDEGVGGLDRWPQRRRRA